MILTKTVVKSVASVRDINRFERFLFISPHPDDVEIGAGATIAKLSSLQKTIRILICTDGRYGTENCSSYTPDQLAELREQESIKAAKRLGVSDVVFLRLPDAEGYGKEDLYQHILQNISDFSPDVVFAPDPDVPNEFHPDHLNVGTAVKKAVYFGQFQPLMDLYHFHACELKAVAFYLTSRPNYYYKTGDYFQKQMESIICHQTQFPAESAAFSSLSRYLHMKSFESGIHVFSKHGEAFRIVSKLAMHCLPEAE